MNISTDTGLKIAIFAGAIIAAYLAVGAFFAHADAAPSVNATIRNSSQGTITSALVGASVHSVVQVASSTTSTIPQGTVDFNVYNGTACAGSPTTASFALSGGFATSSATTVPVGGLSYKVHYGGDVNNIAADSACMPLTATSNTAALSLGLSAATINAGQSVNGTASLSNVASNATGTVAYTVYSNSSCATPYGGAGNVTVTNGSVPNSPPFQFITPGTYYWQAVYSGDMNNNAATSTCASANSILTVQAVGKNSPTINTSLSSSSIQTGTSVNATSALSGATSNASGTVAYKIFTDNACSNLFVNAGTKNVSSASVPNSDSIQFNSVGTYYWRAIFSGDNENNAATSTCGSVLTVVAQGTGTPPAGAGTISGTVFNDKNKNDVRDAGEEGLSGFTINLYNSANFNNNKYDPVFMSATTDGNGNYSFTGLANGTYSVEQLIKDGWKQTTDDFASVAITSGAGVGNLNFGDVAKAGSGENCQAKNNGKNHGKHKDDCNDDGNDDHASSTKPWWRNSHDNGLHLGWVIGKGNQGKNKHGN